MTKHIVALNGDTKTDYHTIKDIYSNLEIVALTYEQLADLEANPHYDHHDWYHEMSSLFITHDGRMQYKVKTDGYIYFHDIGCVPQELGRTYQD